MSSFENAALALMGGAIGIMFLRIAYLGIKSGQVKLIWSQSPSLDLGPYERHLQPRRFWATMFFSFAVGVLAVMTAIGLLLGVA